MDLDLITDFLTDSGDYFPEEALLACRANPEETKPILRELLAEVAEAGSEPLVEVDTQGYLFAMFLLAEMRDREAHTYLLKLLSRPMEAVDMLLGDLLTEAMPSLLASTWDGSPEGLAGVARNRDLDAFVRITALDALLLLFSQGLLPGKTLAALLEEFLDLPGDSGWGSMVLDSAIASRLPALEPRIRQAFDSGASGYRYQTATEWEAVRREDPAATLARNLEFWHLIEDGITEARVWFSLWHEPEEDETATDWPDGDWPSPLAEPRIDAAILQRVLGATSTATGTGTPPRNAPCPCGSGKKFKRCCGA